MSKTLEKKPPPVVLESREATVQEVKRLKFGDIPTDLVNLSFMSDDKTIYVFNLLRWAKRSNQLWDDDEVCFITIKELQNSEKKGNYCLLKESEYPGYSKAGESVKLKAGCKIIMEKDLRYGWQPKRILAGVKGFD